MKEVTNFEINACQVYPYKDILKCEIYIDLDGQDNLRNAILDIEYFAKGENDSIAEDIAIKLSEMGLELIFPGEVVDVGEILFELREINS